MQYSQITIARRIKAEREALGLSKEALGEMLNVNRNTITAWERQDDKGRYPPLGDLARMCELFNCELGYLLGEYNCKTRAVTDIQAETGLSERAIKILLGSNEISKAGEGETPYPDRAQAARFISTLSRLIEHNNFCSFINDLSEYGDIYNGTANAVWNDEAGNPHNAFEYRDELVKHGWYLFSGVQAAEYRILSALDTLKGIALDIWEEG